MSKNIPMSVYMVMPSIELDCFKASLQNHHVPKTSTNFTSESSEVSSRGLYHLIQSKAG